MMQNYFPLNTIFNDAPQPWQLGFQDGINMQCLLILNHTIFWEILIANYSNFFNFNRIIREN